MKPLVAREETAATLSRKSLVAVECVERSAVMSSESTLSKPAKARKRRLVTRHVVRDGIQEMILDGAWQSGTKLVQQQLAKQFGVAQSVVREALIELQGCGLVETVDNRGVFVSKLNTARLLESFDVREVLEGLGARLCCDTVTAADVRALAELVARIYAFGAAGQTVKMGSLDREFHIRIQHLSGNSMLVRLSDSYRILGKVVQGGRDPKETRDEHLAILAAIEERDAAKAERLMREHIRAGKRGTEKTIAAGTFSHRFVL
jgi:DNA-binding GntR family transcriptional regulator